MKLFKIMDPRSSFLNFVLASSVSSGNCVSASFHVSNCSPHSYGVFPNSCGSKLSFESVYHLRTKLITVHTITNTQNDVTTLTWLKKYIKISQIRSSSFEIRSYSINNKKQTIANLIYLQDLQHL